MTIYALLTTSQKVMKKEDLVIDDITLYYDPGMHDIADGAKWKGRLEKRLISLLTRALRNKLGEKISLDARKRV